MLARLLGEDIRKMLFRLDVLALSGETAAVSHQSRVMIKLLDDFRLAEEIACGSRMLELYPVNLNQLIEESAHTAGKERISLQLAKRRMVLSNREVLRRSVDNLILSIDGEASICLRSEAAGEQLRLAVLSDRFVTAPSSNLRVARHLFECLGVTLNPVRRGEMFGLKAEMERSAQMSLLG